MSKSPTYFLPVELWYQILEENISLRTFLDPARLPEVEDPHFNNHDYIRATVPLSLGRSSNRKTTRAELRSKERRCQNEGTYWEMERQRNALRRVCKSWDQFLRLFSHRFVRIQDVFHGQVPIASLCKAIRISLTYCPYLVRYPFAYKIYKLLNH